MARATDDSNELLDVGDELAIDVSVHDSSRLEWKVVVPTSMHHYQLAMQLDVPANLFPPHVPWAQLQSLARFERPHEDCDHRDSVSRLREEALLTTSRLAAARRGFRRHLHRFAGPPVADEARVTLPTWPEAAVAAVARARMMLDAQAEAATERGFVDEYLSTQLVTTLTDMAAVLDELDEETRSRLASVAAGIAGALLVEADHRRAHGYVSIEDTSTLGLERYVERAGLLKKRFQALLYLRRESRPVEERVRPWVAALSAATAGAVAFALQLIFGTARSPATQKVGWSLFVALVLVALSYGTKERLQIAGVHWLSRGLGRLYARRSTRFFTASRRLVLVARESFAEETVQAIDSETTGVATTVQLRFVHEGQLRPPVEHGQLRLLFRYDLSPLFPRLHDPTKTVGVLDRETLTVQFMEAPRTYRIPVRVEFSSGDIERAVVASVVMDKFGLHRVEPGGVTNV